MFTRYLIRADATERVQLGYARGLNSRSFLDAAPRTAQDRMLVRIAARGPFMTGLADAWARFFAPAGDLRRRLTLLLAILESTSPGEAAFEPPAGGRVRAIVGVLGAAAGFAVRLLLAFLVIAPRHALLRLRASA